VTDQHPLDPLTADEIRHVQALLAREHGVRRPEWRIASIELREPAKDLVRAHRPGDPVARTARVVLWRTGDGLAFVAMLSLTDDTVVAWEPQPGRQPPATVDEWHDCDEAMRAHPQVVAALAGRGISDPELVLVDVWTDGAHLIPPRYAGRRIGWCDVWVRATPDGNPYAHPVAGL
jgi:primary-amine oxidase